MTCPPTLEICTTQPEPCRRMCGSAARGECRLRVRPNWRLQLRQIDWNDRSGGLRDGSSDLAIVWLPVPAADRFSQLVLVQEPRHVALRAAHPLAGRREIDFSELLDEAFLALPDDAGSPRDYWLALEHRDGRPPRIGGIVTNAERAVLVDEPASE